MRLALLVQGAIPLGLSSKPGLINNWVSAQAAAAVVVVDSAWVVVAVSARVLVVDSTPSVVVVSARTVVVVSQW